MWGTHATLRNTGTIINATPATGPAGAGVRLPLPISQTTPPAAPAQTPPSATEHSPAADTAPADTVPTNAAPADSAPADAAPADEQPSTEPAADEPATDDSTSGSPDGSEPESPSADKASDEAAMEEEASYPSEESDDNTPLISPEEAAATTAQYARLKDPLYVGGFGSAHPGGANFIFGDGSVRYLSDSMDHRAFIQAGNRADGELPLPGITND